MVLIWGFVQDLLLRVRIESCVYESGGILHPSRKLHSKRLILRLFKTINSCHGTNGH